MITDFNIATYGQPFRILHRRRLLARAESWSPEQLRDYQDRRLRELIRYAATQVPYYRDLFRANKLKPDDIRGAADLGRVPVLTKDIIREQAERLRSDEFRSLRPVPVHTSGSTGSPLEFYADRHVAAAKFATFWRAWNWAGYRFGQRWALIAGPVFEDGALFKRLRTMNALYISSFRLDTGSIGPILDAFRTFRPGFLRGYPSALAEFARLAAPLCDLKSLGIRAVSTNSETLLDYQREHLQAAFGCRVFDVYSQWEQVCVISDCEHQIRHHQMEYGVLELLDDNGDRIETPGHTGEITGTALDNRAMPLIRYRTGDHARLGAVPCPCGRAHTVVEQIDGRIEDVVLTPDGRRIGRMDAAFKHNEGFDAAQIVQTEAGSIRVRLVRNARFRPDELQLLERHIRDRIGTGLEIRFEFADRIEPGPNGKVRFVVNKLLHAPGGMR